MESKPPRPVVTRKKTCPGCGRYLWKRDFYKSGGYCTTLCKECQKKKVRKWWLENKKLPDKKYVDPSTGLLMEKKGSVTRIYWSPNMISIMYRYFPTTPNAEMLELLNVSQRTLSKKAKELGLKKDKEWFASYIKNKIKYVKKRKRKETTNRYVSNDETGRY